MRCVLVATVSCGPGAAVNVAWPWTWWPWPGAAVLPEGPCAGTGARDGEDDEADQDGCDRSDCGTAPAAGALGGSVHVPILPRGVQPGAGLG